MEFDVDAFLEDTAFEQFALAEIGTRPIAVGTPKYTHHGDHIIGHLGTAESGTRLRDALRKSLQPLGFGAAFKVLDLLVEHVLQSNEGVSKRMTFVEKITLARSSVDLPSPLAVEMWQTLASLYAVFIEARHALVHRRFEIGPGGEINFVRPDGKNDVVTPDEIDGFVDAVRATTVLVAGSRPDARQSAIVGFYLNSLIRFHQCERLPSVNPAMDHWLLDAELSDLGDGSVGFNLRWARSVIAGQKDEVFWDVHLRCSQGAFVGRWEDLDESDKDSIEFSIESPPTALTKSVT